MRTMIRAAAFLIAVATPLLAPASIVMDVEVTCPIDGERFTSKEAMSGSQFGQNLDRRPLGAVVAPWPISRCPRTGFVIYKDDFTNRELERLRPHVRSKTYQALQKNASDYYLAAHLMRFLGAPKSVIADALLKATWEVEQDPRYKRYAVDALAAFDELASDSSLEATPADRASYHQIAGELERRLGLFDKANQRFKYLIEAPGVKGSRLEQLVRQEIVLTEARDSRTQPVAGSGKRRP